MSDSIQPEIHFIWYMVHIKYPRTDVRPSVHLRPHFDIFMVRCPNPFIRRAVRLRSPSISVHLQMTVVCRPKPSMRWTVHLCGRPLPSTCHKLSWSLFESFHEADSSSSKIRPLVHLKMIILVYGPNPLMRFLSVVHIIWTKAFIRLS